MTDRTRQASPGFTLMEILVAILIFSVIMTALFTSFRAFILSSRRVKEQVVRDEAVLALNRRIRLDLEAVFVTQPPRYQKPGFDADPDPYRFFGKQETLGDRVVSSFFFASLAHVGNLTDRRSGVARIGYYVRQNPDQTLDLCRADRLAPFPDDVGSCADPVLCRDITEFSAEFVDANGEARKTWNSDGEDCRWSMPAAVRLNITMKSGDDRPAIEIFVRPGAARGALD